MKTSLILVKKFAPSVNILETPEIFNVYHVLVCIGYYVKYIEKKFTKRLWTPLWLRHISSKSTLNKRELYRYYKKNWKDNLKGKITWKFYWFDTEWTRNYIQNQITLRIPLNQLNLKVETAKLSNVV